MAGCKRGENYDLHITLRPKHFEQLQVCMEIEEEQAASPTIRRAIDYYYKKYSHIKRNEIRERLGLPLDEK